VGVVVFGFYLSQSLIAGEQLPQVMNISSLEAAVTVTARRAEPQDYPVAAGAAMGSTINIPPSAFIPAWPRISYYEDSMTGYLQGGSGYPLLVAPVIFPRDAKKIFRVDFWIMDSGSSGSHAGVYAMFSIKLGTSGSESIVDPSSISYNNGNIFCYTSKPPKGTVWSIYPDRLYHVEVILLQSAYLYGVVVYYQ
jgi:hypothetical protein